MTKEQIIKEVLEESVDKTINHDFISFDEQFRFIIERTLQKQEDEILKIIDKMKNKTHITNIHPSRFSTDKQRKVVELLMVKVSNDYLNDLEELKQKIKQ